MAKTRNTQKRAAVEISAKQTLTYTHTPSEEVHRTRIIDKARNAVDEGQSTRNYPNNHNHNRHNRNSNNVAWMNKTCPSSLNALNYNTKKSRSNPGFASLGTTL